jgi:type II secretory pathway component PulF
MFSRETTLTEFYLQLRIILDAELPLPDGLAEIASGMQGPLKRVCEQLRADIHGGLDLPAAMRRQPTHFPTMHVRALDASPDTLPVLAELSADRVQFTMRVRQGLAYPLGVIILSVGLLAGLMLTVAPMFATAVTDLGIGQGSVLYRASGASSVWLSLLIVASMALLVHCWLLLPGRRSDALLARLLFCVPGSGSIMMAQDHALLCTLWAALMRAGAPDSKLLDKLEHLLLHPRLRKQVADWRAALEQGRTLADAILSDPQVDPRFRQTFGSSESGRADALARSADYYRTHSRERSDRVAALWALACTLGMIVVVGLVVLGLFRPLTWLF